MIDLAICLAIGVLAAYVVLLAVILQELEKKQ